MNIADRKSKKSLWLIPGVVSLIATIYSAYTLIVSKLLPMKHLTLFIVVSIAIFALIFFLLLRRFQRGRLFARIVGVLLSLIMLLGAVLGSYILQKGVNGIDNLSKGVKNTVTLKNNESFNLFISGIDTYGDVSKKSRSDVNIVATINPNTHKVLLTTIPRDSRVKIALGGNNQYDKITHAGIYGPESSMKTAANLLNTDINAYLRINFTSFIKSIDLLGGVDVDNPVAFSAQNGEFFQAGKIHLDGDRALAFSRERKHLAGGDIDRGKNQDRVISAIINKITSIRSLDGYNALLEAIDGSVDTNVSGPAIRSLINRQIDEPSAWQTTSYYLEGKGTPGLSSYAMPNAKLYMYTLDQESINKASKQITDILSE